MNTSEHVKQYRYTNHKTIKIMRKELVKDSCEYKAAMELENALNNMCFDYKMFTESIRCMHPTLQQNLFRLIKECIIWMSDENNRYIDARNRASLEGSKKLLKALEEISVPFV